MHSVTLLAVLVAMVASVAMAADVMVNVDQISVHIMEKSGMMKVTATEVEKESDDGNSGGAGAATTAEPAETTVAPTTTTTQASAGRKRRAADDLKTNDVEVSFVSLQEIDDQGNMVGANKENSQALAAFTEVTFTFGTKNEDSTIPNSKNKDNAAIKALEQTYETSLGSGKLKVYVYIAKEAGNITLGETGATEVTPVEEGQVKFSVELEGWVWCTEADDNCKNAAGDETEVGAGVDLVMTVKGNGDAEAADSDDGMAKTYKIGNDNHLFISSKVKKTPATGDAEWMDMAENFPKVEKDGADTSKLTVRLPWSDKSVLYDPSLRLKIPGGDGVSASTTIAASMGLLIAALLAAIMRL